MEKWVKGNIKKEFGKVKAVGTGGNISKIYELANQQPGQIMSIMKVKEIKKMIEALPIEQRIYELEMNHDRADVIIPASDIYLKVMEWAHANSILVPDVGLKDGILLHLLEKNVKQKKIEFKNSRF